jgi:cell wall-associated NlpC family hydrolase
MRNLGSHAWDHYCLRFVGDCYARGARASVHRYDTARQAAAALHASAHRDFNAPRGAWVFYDSTKLGHVGISLGNGTMINDYGSQGVKIMGITQAGHYVGWAVPPLSPAITDWNQPTK